MNALQRFPGAVLFLLLGSTVLSQALAADRNPQSPPGALGQSLPAVDGLNAEAVGFGGATDGRALYGGAGSVTMPLGYRYGLQIDGIGANFDSPFQGNVAGGGVAVHPFWRDPSVGLLGAFGAYFHTDAFSGADIFAAAPQGALYLGRFTLEGMAGVQGGHADQGTQGRVNTDTRFFDVATVAYYPIDNLDLSIGHAYVSGRNAAIVSAELGLPIGGGTMPALFVAGSFADGGDSTVLAGMHFYFGQRDKTLIRRHREDDPLGLSSPLGLAAATGGKGGAGGTAGLWGAGGAGGTGQ